MTTYNVSTTAALQSALTQAHAGDSILLAAGTYSGLSISNLNIAGGSVSIASQNAATPAVLTNFNINSSSGLSFSHLDFSATGPTGAAYSFLVNNSQNISYDSLTVHGTIGSTPYNNPSAFYFENSSNVSVTNSSFSYLQVGIIGSKSQYMTYDSNSFKWMGVDGIDNAGVSNVQINNNYFTDFVPGPGAHPDAIQFWTEGTSTSAHDLTITGNVYTRGSGGPLQTQGIFVQDDSGTLPYINVTITGNEIYGGAYNGIYVLQAQNLNVSHNIVAGYSDMESWIYGKGVSGSVNNNSAQEYILGGNTGLTQTGDLTTGAVAPTAPVLANSGTAPTYTPGGAAAAIAHLLTLTDTNVPSIASAKVAITGGFLAGDTLNFTNQNGITGSYNAATGVLTLSGTEAQTVYQAALESITFSSSAANPTNGGADASRTISFSVNDGAAASNTLTAAVSLTSSSPPPAGPSLSNSGAAVTYAPGGAAADIAHALADADPSSTTLASASVAITGGFLAGDALNFANQNGITGSYNSSTGVLTLTGTASLANYQTALDAITYASSASDPTHGGTDLARTVSFTVNDGAKSSSALAATVDVSRPAAPSLSNTGAAVTYAPGGAAADIAHSLGVTDAESTTLASAKVAITGGFLAGDALNFANQNGITGSYNSSTGVLTLTGTASLANYQTALESITYASSVADPTHGATDLARTVSFTVNDGVQSSSALAATVNVSRPAAPSLSNTGAAVTYAPGGAAADIAHSLGVTDAESTTLASAKVAITGGFLAGDALNFTNQNGITGSYNSSTGVLTLSGTASLANYQTALESITYASSVTDPTHGGTDLARTVSFTVNDGVQSSSTLAATVNVSRPAAPSLSNTGAAVTYVPGGVAADIAHSLGVTDAESTTLASAKVAITGGFLAGDALNFANQNGITGAYNASTGVLTLTGVTSLANYKTALDSITYTSSVADPTHGGTDLARTVSFTVNDGVQSSSALAATVNVSRPSAPILTNSGPAVTYVAGGAAADIAHSLGVTDAESTTLVFAKAAITGGFLPGDALHFTNQNGITGSYDSSTGVLTLNGTASLASYQAALDSITYSSSSKDPTHGGTDLTRSISFSVYDSAQRASALTTTVNVSRPAPPSLSNSGAAVTYSPGGAAADIAHSLAVTDPSSTTLSFARVAIASGFLAGDALHFTNQSGISGSYNASTGVLTLSGTASLANYKTALDSITYSSSASDPTHGGTDLARSVSFSVWDGAQRSNSLTATVNVLRPVALSLSKNVSAAIPSGAAAHSLAATDPSSTASAMTANGLHADSFIYAATASTALGASALHSGSTFAAASDLDSAALFGLSAASTSAAGSHPLSESASFDDTPHLAATMPLLGGLDGSHHHMSMVGGFA